MRRAEAFACLGVEVLEEQDEVLPVRIVREELRRGRSARAVHRPIAAGIRQKDVDHAVGQSRGETGQRDRLRRGRCRGPDRHPARACAGSDPFTGARVGRPGGGDRTVAFFRHGHAHVAAEPLLQLAQRLDHQERCREPHRPAPVAVAALQPRARFSRLVADRRASERERMLLVKLAQAAHAERGEKLVRVDEAAQEVLQLVLIDDREHVRVRVVIVNGRHAALDDLGAMLDEPVHVLPEDGEGLDPLFLETLDRVQRNEPDQRPYPERHTAPVAEPQDVVEEPILGVPEGAVAADHLHRRADVDVVFEEFRGQTFVDGVGLRQFERDPHHHQREHAHPARGVALLEHSTLRNLAAIEERDVVEAEEAAFEDVVAAAVDFVHPPCEVEQQFVKAALEEFAIAFSAADAVHVVDAPDRPRLDRRIEIGELPLVCGDLPVRMLELLEEHQPELFLRVVRIDEREHDRVEREIPRREPRVLPLVGHGEDAHRVEVPPPMIAPVMPLLGRGTLRIVSVQPHIDIEQVALLAPQHPRERLALDVLLFLRRIRRMNRCVELIGLGAAKSDDRVDVRPLAALAGRAESHAHHGGLAGFDFAAQPGARLRPALRRIRGAAVTSHDAAVKRVLVPVLVVGEEELDAGRDFENIGAESRVVQQTLERRRVAVVGQECAAVFANHRPLRLAAAP